MNWIRVPRWTDFQHYTDRNPPWIKLHSSLLENYEFQCLQDASKLHLVMIWLLASRRDNHLPADPKWLASKIGATEPVNLQVLVQYGFLELEQDASTTLAPCKQSACPETETETEGEGEAEKDMSPAVALVKVDRRTVQDVVDGLTAGVVDRMTTRREVTRVQVELLFAYWAKMTGHPGALLDRKRAARLEARLREHDDIHEHLYVVDGALKDRNLMGENDRGTKYDGIETLYRDRGQVERLSALGGYVPGKPHPMAVKYLGAA